MTARMKRILITSDNNLILFLPLISLILSTKKLYPNRRMFGHLIIIHLIDSILALCSFDIIYCHTLNAKLCKI